jgi:hypothetical protein
MGKVLFAAVAFMVVGHWIGASVDQAHAQKAGPQTISARTITLVDEDGNVGVTLTASRNNRGIWVKAPNGETVAVYGDRSQGAVIGLYERVSDDVTALPFAVAVQKGGEPFVQVAPNGTGKGKGFKVKDISTLVK